MKTITLTEPWASLVRNRAKKIETRSWQVSYRGTLAIHAAKGMPGYAREFCQAGGVQRALGWPAGCDVKEMIKTLPLGKVIAVCHLVDVVPTDAVDTLYPDLMTEQELSFGNYENGRWAWILSHIRPVEPVEAKGSLGLWEWKEWGEC